MVGRKIKICIEENCHNAETTDGYCRLHYLKNWKLIKEKEKKKAADRLNKYVEGICKRNPDDYMSAVKKDIRNEKSLGDVADGLVMEDDVEAAFSDLEKDGTSLDKILNQMRIHEKF